MASLSILKRFHDLGISEVNGHLLYRVPDSAYEEAFAWLGLEPWSASRRERGFFDSGE